MKDVKARWDTNAKSVGDLTLYLQPDLPDFVSSALGASAKNAMRLYGKEWLPDATLFAGTKSDWYVQVFCENRYPAEMQASCLQGNYGGPGGGSGWPQEYPQVDAYGAVYGSISKSIGSYIPSPAYIYLSSFKDKNTVTASVHSAPAHELFHAMQAFQFGRGSTTSESAKNFSTKYVTTDGSNNLAQFPTFWVEGSAFYFGYAAAEMANPGIMSKQGLPLKPSWITSEHFTLDQVLNWTVNDMIKSPDKGNYVYFSGAIMTELMVADFGLDKVFDFTKNASMGLTDATYNFSKNFKYTFGVEWSVWSPKADLYLSNTLDGKPTYAKDMELSAHN